MNEEYLLKVFESEDDLKLYKDCFDNNDDKKRIESINWLHINNVCQKAYVDFAIHKKSKQVGGIYAVFPGYFKLYNKVVEGCQSIDTLVDTAHRRKGLFTSLARSLYARCNKSGVQFVYGFPNEHSQHGFFNKLEWNNLGDVPFLLKVYNLGYVKKKYNGKLKFLLKVLPNLRIAKRQKVSLPSGIEIRVVDRMSDVNIDHIWKDFSKEINFAVNRDTDYFIWRIDQKPFFDYKILALYDSTNRILGFTIYSIVDKHDGKIAYIIEHMYLSEFKSESDQLLKKVSNELIKNNVDVLLAWCCDHSESYSSFKNAGMIQFPKRLQPIKLFFGIRFFGEKKIERQDIYLSYCDSDTV